MTGRMDRDDILDLLAIIAAGDNRTVGETDVTIWGAMIGGLPKDDCLAAVEAHRKEQPGVWLEPGHVVQRVRAVMRDRFDRLDPDDRGDAWADLGGRPSARGEVRLDRHGVADKSEPDPEYPPDWSADQRLAAYWKRVRSGTSMRPDPEPVVTARDEHPPAGSCAGRGCGAPSTFGDYCARHYVLYAAWSRKGPTRVPAGSLSELFDRTADEVIR